MVMNFAVGFMVLCFAAAIFVVVLVVAMIVFLIRVRPKDGTK